MRVSPLKKDDIKEKYKDEEEGESPEDFLPVLLPLAIQNLPE